MEKAEDKNLASKKGALWPIARVFDKTIDTSAILAMLLLSFCAIITTLEIIMRFFFNRPLMWSIEVTEYSLIWLTFLGTTWVLRKEGHVIVDVVVMRIPQVSRYMLDAVLSIIGIMMCLLLTGYGVKVTLEYFQIARPMSTILMPPAWILYLIIPLGSLMLTVQFIRRTRKYFSLWKTSRKKIPEPAV